MNDYISFSTIHYSISDRIAYITLYRPDKRNALNNVMINELKEAFQLANTDKNVKVVVLKGSGKAFCSGLDLEYLQKMQLFTYEENLADSNNLKELFYQIYTLGKVVIGQVNGHAIAGGCGLATLCDFSFASSEAKFGYTEVKIGFVPAIVKVFLLRKIGEGKSKELLLSGNLISAEKAKEYGLINYVIKSDALEEAVNEFAKELVNSNSAQAMGLTKKMIAEVQTMNLPEALKYAAEMNAKARGSDDCKKGVSGFLNKENLEW